MPLWDFHYTGGGLSVAEREQLSTQITKMYTSVGMPAFYVQVRFQEMTSNTLYIGGEDQSTTETSSSKYAAIQIYHVARDFTSDIAKRQFLNAADKILGRVFEGKGWDWEYWVIENPRELWKTNGIFPPPTGSETEKRWAEANRPIKGISFGKL